MATTIGISTGGLTAINTYSNDAAAQTILLKCADRLGLTGTNQQKLAGIVNWCVGQIEGKAAEQDFDDQRATLMATIQQGNKLT